MPSYVQGIGDYMGPICDHVCEICGGCLACCEGHYEETQHELVEEWLTEYRKGKSDAS